MSYFWENLVLLIPETLKHGEISQQFFDITLFVFRSIDDTGREDINLEAYTERWSGLLLRHIHEEVSQLRSKVYLGANILKFVGRDSIDWIVFGIAGLLQWCIQFTKSLKKPMNIQYENLLSL